MKLAGFACAGLLLFAGAVAAQDGGKTITKTTIRLGTATPVVPAMIGLPGRRSRHRSAFAPSGFGATAFACFAWSLWHGLAEPKLA